MKTLHVFTTVLTSAAISISSVFADEPSVPVGELNINTELIRKGGVPDLSWQIMTPQKVTDLIEIDPVTDVIAPKQQLRVKVSVVGVGIADQYGREYPAWSSIKFGSSSWCHIFDGTGSQVDPSEICVEKIVEPGEEIRFAAKYSKWQYNDDPTVKVLKNGDTPPTLEGGLGQDSVEDYLKPYIKDGKIALGPFDVIYVAELTHTNPANSGYDMQDTIVLVRFEAVNGDSTEEDYKPGRGGGHNGGDNKNNKQKSSSTTNGGYQGGGYEGGGYHNKNV